ncbi:MAG: alpha/beta hydrolase [Bacillota bacterium]
MSTGTMHFFSKALGRFVRYSLVLPNPEQAGPGPYPVLYQLHGAEGDDLAWLELSNFARHLRGTPFIAVLPDGALSYWLDYSPRERYESMLIEDLPRHLASLYQVDLARACIGGLSMGGYGALRLALKYPEHFVSAYGHSSALWSREEWQARQALPTDIDDADIDLWVKRSGQGYLPAIGFDCGESDAFINHNRRLHHLLDRCGIAHGYQEFPGGHSWDYWDEHVRRAIAQHLRAIT